MTRPWQIVILAGLMTLAIKASGPLVFGRWSFSPSTKASLALMAPALLAALVANQTAASGGALVVDARIAGTAVAVAGAGRGISVPIVIVAAVLVTAAVRVLL